MDALPIIDLSPAIGPSASPDGRDLVAAQMVAAMHGSGFCYVTGHQVPDSVTSGIMVAAEQFFALPLDERLALDNVASPHFRGYTSLGNEYTKGQPDQREQLDVGPERTALDLAPTDPAYLRMTGPNLWPESAPQVREAVLAWYDEAARVSIDILRLLARGLGQDDSWFDRWFDEDAHHHLKVVRYPGIPEGETERQGVGAHKDYGWLALLLQDNIGGLQVRTGAGTWIDAVPIPGTFVVNVGEMLEVTTHGFLKATVHRVTSPTSNRISVPFFLGPRLDALIPAFPLRDNDKSMAEGIDADPDNPMFAVYGDNALKGWLRAHPRVAERWYQ